MFCIPNDYTFLQYKRFGLALSSKKIYGKVYTSDSLLETVLYWGINCTITILAYYHGTIRFSQQ